LWSKAPNGFEAVLVEDGFEVGLGYIVGNEVGGLCFGVGRGEWCHDEEVFNHERHKIHERI